MQPVSEKMRARMAARLDADLREMMASAFKLSPDYSGSEYADEHGVLIEDGKVRHWRCFPFQREIADSMHSVDTKETIVMKSARLGISELTNHQIQRLLVLEPTAVALYRHDNASCERWVRGRFNPRVKFIPDLKAQILLDANGKSKEKATERLLKNGASLLVLSADNEDNFRDLTLKKVFLDELDAQGFAPEPEGLNKYNAAVVRVKQYWDGKVVALSTPTVPADEGGRTHALFLESDQRHRFVQCPHCGYEFTPHWGDADSIGGMRWNKDDPLDASGIYYECHNPDLEVRCRIEEYHKREMDEKAKWVALNPGHYRRGYYIWQWFSPLAGATWPDMVREWNEALRSGGAAIQGFKNEVLGLPYSQGVGMATASHETLARCITDLGVAGAEVPAWAVGLFWGIDRQKGGIDESMSYLEASLYAFGPGRRLFLVGHWVLDEHPQKEDACWDALEKLVTRTFIDTEGRPRKADGIAIDHNGGYTQRLENWLLEMRAILGRKTWVAVRGESTGTGVRRLERGIWPPTSSKKNAAVYTIDVDIAKDDLLPILADGLIEFNANPIEGSVNLSDQAEADRFFKRMLLEKRYPIPNKPGAYKWSAPKGLGRNGNEPSDCLVYAWALSHGMTQSLGTERLKFRKAFALARPEGEAPPAPMRKLPALAPALPSSDDEEETLPETVPVPVPVEPTPTRRRSFPTASDAPTQAAPAEASQRRLVKAFPWAGPPLDRK